MTIADSAQMVLSNVIEMFPPTDFVTSRGTICEMFRGPSF